jgi:hypothetical protein
MSAWSASYPVRSQSLKEIMDEQQDSSDLFFLPPPPKAVLAAVEETAPAPTTAARSQEDEDELLAKTLQAIEQEELLTSELQHYRDIESVKSSGTEKIQIKYQTGPQPTAGPSSSTNGLLAYTKIVENLEASLKKKGGF